MAKKVVKEERVQIHLNSISFSIWGTRVHRKNKLGSKREVAEILGEGKEGKGVLFSAGKCKKRQVHF